MSRGYDILVVDLDGTLLARDGSVSRRNRAAIDDARAAGLAVIIATGRSLQESIPSLRAIDHDGMVIAAGGSLLCDAATGVTLERRVLCPEVVARIAAVLASEGHPTLILKDTYATGYDYLVAGSGGLHATSVWWFRTLEVKVRTVDEVDDDPHPHDTVRAGAVAAGETIAPIAETLRAELGADASLQHWSAVTSTEATGSPTHVLEVFHPHVNKWSMVQACCRRLGADEARVVAVGDGLNDTELVENAGLGIAMGNAMEPVKSRADRVTSDHDEDGLAIAVEQVLSGAW